MLISWRWRNRRPPCWFRCALPAALLSLLPTAASTEPVTLAGITFSDEQGGVVILGGSGRGTPDDPFVLVEEITEEGPAILTIRGLDRRPAGMSTAGAAGFSLVKIVTNRTPRPWTVFELELREELERPSGYSDGLSFGQTFPDLAPFTADRFARVQRRDEPLDAVEFDDGLVEAGGKVRVSMLVTDFTPRPELYLLQRRDGRIAALPIAPSSRHRR